MNIAVAVISPIAYGPLDRIRIGRIAYTCVKTNEHSHEFARACDPDMVEIFSHADIARIEKTDAYRYDRDWFKSGQAKARDRSGVEHLSEIPKRELPRILLRWEFCNRFRLMSMTGKAKATNAGMTEAIELIALQIKDMDFVHALRAEEEWTGKPPARNSDGSLRKPRLDKRVAPGAPPDWIPNYRSVQRWLKILEECDWEISGLRTCYRRSGNRTPRLEPEAHDLLVENARKYATAQRHSVAEVHDLLDVAITARNSEREREGLPPLACPSKRRLHREIKGLDAFWVYSRRHTPEAAQKKFAGIEDGPVATRIGERIEMDEWNVGLQTLLVKAQIWPELNAAARAAIERARPCLYVAIDRASRCVLAMRMTDGPRASEAVATIRTIISDKTAFANGAGAKSAWMMSTGIGRLVTDWGNAFYSTETRRVVTSMGATYDHPPAGMAQLRGTVERMFSTYEKRFTSHFSGRTFSNVVQKGDYDAEANASVPFEVLARAIVRYVVDDYHHRPHAGLGGETPYNAWVRLAGSTGRLPAPDSHVQRAIFGILDENCTLDGSGVVCLGLRYQNRELFEHFTARGVTTVAVRIDPQDVGWASVKIGDDWIDVPCRKKELRGVRLRDWIETAMDLKTRFKNAASLSRPTVLAAVRDLAALGQQLRDETGISEALDTPESLARAKEALGLGFELPEWNDETPASDGGDVLANTIRVGAPPVALPASDTLPDLPDAAPPEAAGWSMGPRNENGR